MSLRNYPKPEKSGSYRGAGAYSKDYAKFDVNDQNYGGREIWSKVEGVGDYDGPFTGPVFKTPQDRNRWEPLADRMNTRGDIGIDGAKSRSNGDRPRKQSDGPAWGGQKVGDNTDW